MSPGFAILFAPLAIAVDHGAIRYPELTITTSPARTIAPTPRNPRHCGATPLAPRVSASNSAACPATAKTERPRLRHRIVESACSAPRVLPQLHSREHRDNGAIRVAYRAMAASAERM